MYVCGFVIDIKIQKIFCKIRCEYTYIHTRSKLYGAGEKIILKFRLEKVKY